MTKQNAKMITARDLLHGFLELRGLTPDIGDWTEGRLSANPPRLCRLRRLIALFRAFEIAWDPPSFVEGKFIQPGNPRYAALPDMMASGMPEEGRPGLGADDRQLPDCFRVLLRYRERVEEVLSFSSGVLAAGGLYRYAHRRVGALNRIIAGEIAPIENILSAFISPEARVFAVEALARDYGYPDVDLSELDAEWM